MATVLDRDVEQGADAERERTPAAERPRRRRIVWAVVAVVALALAVWGVRVWLYARAHESTDDAQVDGRIVPVLAKIGGYVTSVPVEDNAHVSAGQPLVQLDDAEYRVRLEQAEADLRAAQATAGAGEQTGQAESQVQSAASERSSLEARIAAARADSGRAAADLARMRTLADKQIVSRQQLDAAEAAAAAATANLQAVERQAAAAGAAVTTARAGVRLAEAKLQAARAARDNAALQLSYTHITAPEAGTVARKSVEVGQLVQPGQPLMSIVADSGVWITANFKETQLGDLHRGAAATIDVDAYPGCEATGYVESLSPATGATFALIPPDNATGNFTKVVQRVPVRILVRQGCGAQRPLRPGMSVEVHVATQ
ncbi:MAG TPA: HlyD family secretion protein [Gemmatimonadaceae bacterium]|nr:HlyD family secretion protein [Gemmatimonadaceae bacterium]